MFSIFKPKESRSVLKTLKTCGFYEENIVYFGIEDIANQLIQRKQIATLYEVVSEMKLDT
jgi:hypothetical protein